MNQTLVIGSAVVDVIVRVEHLPKCGEDVHVSRQSRSLGGCAYLVSDILRHFGAPYSLCTAVGGGMYGDFVYELSASPNPAFFLRWPASSCPPNQNTRTSCWRHGCFLWFRMIDCLIGAISGKKHVVSYQGSIVYLSLAQRMIGQSC